MAKPNAGMKAEAQKGLDWRKEFKRGGTRVGVTRANQIVNGVDLSDSTIKRMYSYFSRHEVDKKAKGFRPGEEGFPSRGRIAWALWGGDPGFTWSRNLVEKMKKEEERFEQSRPYPGEHAARIEDPEQFDRFRRKNDEFKKGIHVIHGIKNEERLIQSIRFDSDLYSADEAKAWLEEHDFEYIKFEAAIEERAISEKTEEALKNKVEEHNKEVNNASSKKTNLRVLKQVYERGIGAFNTNPGSVRPNVSNANQWAMARVNSFLFALRNGKYRSGKHDTDLLPDSHPLSSKDKEKAMNKDDRHILDVQENEDSVVIEFSKHHEDEKEEIIDEESVNSYYDDEEERYCKNDELSFRTIDLSKASYIDEDKRMVRIGVSSEEPVQRKFGMEILSHKPEHINMEFMQSGRAPLLLGHDHDEQIGVIREFNLDESNKRTVAMVEFGKGQRASEIFEDVKAGIRQNISVGYIVNKLARMEDDEERESYLATSWTPMEASLVSIPADTSRFVGVGRSQKSNKEIIMSEDKKIDEKAIRSESGESAKAEAIKNAKEILDLGKHHGQRDLADEAIANGLSVEQFRGVLLEKISNDKPLEVAPADLGLNEEEKREYSLLRAINAAASGDWRQAGYERELSDEIASRTGKEARGFYVPADIQWGQRDQTVGTNSQGGFLKPTEHLGDQFIEALYSKLTITGLGARVMQGLKGDIAIPKMSTSVTNSAFVAEGSAPSEGAAVFAQVTMSPKTLAAYVDVSRKLMMQSDPSVEQLLRNDIVNTFARKIDEVAIEGGGSNEPSGILQNSDAATVAIGTNGGAVTYAKVVDLVKEVEIDNAIIGDRPAFLTNPKVISKLRTIAKQGSGVEGNFILDPNNTMLGYGVESTNLVPSDLTKGTGTALSALIFGDFSQLMLGFYSGVDVVVDQASLSTSGGTRLAFFQDLDVAVRHGQAFSFIKDITTT